MLTYSLYLFLSVRTAKERGILQGSPESPTVHVSFAAEDLLNEGYPSCQTSDDRAPSSEGVASPAEHAGDESVDTVLAKSVLPNCLWSRATFLRVKLSPLTVIVRWLRMKFYILGYCRVVPLYYTECVVWARRRLPLSRILTVAFLFCKTQEKSNWPHFFFRNSIRLWALQFCSRIPWAFLFAFFCCSRGATLCLIIQTSFSAGEGGGREGGGGGMTWEEEYFR